ncbi:MAG: hypothetical protein WC881_00230 [Elusimicrobiota bacterium]
MILKEPALPDIRTLARVLASERGCPEADALSEARGAWGLAALDQEPPAAQRLAAALAAAGIPALALPQNLLEELPPVTAVTRAEISGSEVRLQDSAAAAHLLAAGDIALLSAAVIKRRVTQTITLSKGSGILRKTVQLGALLATGLPFPLGNARREETRSLESSELARVLDICLRSPARRLRLESEDFDYSCLLARKTYQALANFRTLARELAALWPDAQRNHGLHILQEGLPLRDMRYDSLADLDRESRWLLTLRSLRSAP